MARWFQSIRIAGHETRYERECREFDARDAGPRETRHRVGDWDVVVDWSPTEAPWSDPPPRLVT